jgi:RND family efflux transporter MFP subunit
VKLLKILLPLAVVTVGALIATAMIRSRPEPETREVTIPQPLVRVQVVEPVDLRLTVRSQGTVSPRTESVLVPEVAGRVTYGAPSFASGGFFENDEPLLRLESADYEQAVVEAEAAVARAELRLAQESAEADVARNEWGELGEGDAPSLTLRAPQLAEARASVEAARAALARARRNLRRTEIRAPFAGRVREKRVDVGQFVAPGTPLATVYAVDYAEVRLPLPDDELAFLDLPLDYRGDRRGGGGPRVTLEAGFAGKRHRWQGRIVRTEGEIDPRSRMIHAVAEVADPYARGDDPQRPPLAAGLFVHAEIEGKLAEGVVRLPRSALRDEGRLLVVDADGRLRFRAVELLRLTENEVLVAAGLEAGERVCVSPLATVTDGMRVRTGEGG